MANALDTARRKVSADRRAVLVGLRAHATAHAPLDSYAVAKLTGLTPMESARALEDLRRNDLAFTPDPLGTLNDLAARFHLTAAGLHAAQ